MPVEREADGALGGRSVQRSIRRIGLDAGIENLMPNVLRHTFAKNLVDSGAGLETVAALLGTGLNAVRIYSAPSPQDLEKAVERISKR